MEDLLAVDELHALEDLSEEVPALGLGQLVVLGADALEELTALEVLRQQHALFLALEVVHKPARRRGEMKDITRRDFQGPTSAPKINENH